MDLNTKVKFERKEVLYKKIFVDTNPLIYLVNEQEPYFSKVLNFLTASIDNDSEFYTSTITDSEFLVKPFSDNNLEQVKKYRLYLHKLDFLKCYISEQVAELAAKLRAKYQGIKLADALQLASCIDCKCDGFLTNDKQLKQVSEVNVIYLGDL